MPLVIDYETMQVLGGRDVVDAQIAAFQQALVDHASTVDVPAPVAPNSIIEMIVRQYEGQYTAQQPPSPVVLPPDNYKPMIRRRADKLMRAGDVAGALLILKSIGE